MQSIWWWCLWTRRSNVVFETHLLHARHLQVNLDGCGATLFFLDVHVVCQQQQTNLFFCQTAFCIFLEAAWCFWRSLWTRRTFLEFEVIWECFGNGDEFNQHEFINVKLNVFGAFGICVIPLPCSRRDKCKKTNIAQCMLHEQRTFFALVVSCVEKSWATGAVRAVVLGFCVFV